MSRITQKVLRYFYSAALLGYAFFLSFSLIISLLESFSYSGFFLKHFNVPLEFFVYVYFICGFSIFIIPTDLILGPKLAKLLKKFLLGNIFVLVALFLTTLVLNGLERINYNNFVYSKIHLQPRLLIKTVVVQMFSVCVNFWLVVRAGGYGRLFKIRILRGIKISTLAIKNFAVTIYSAVLLVFILVTSLIFVTKFYTEKNSFLGENELKYALKKMNIYQWVETFFPETKDLVNWCDQKKEPVELVTFDPEILWMNYEGLSRVFLTNCYYANILSVYKTYDYVGKDNLYLVSVTACDPKSKEDKGDRKADKMDYFKAVNNYYICHSSEILPNLYLYGGGEFY